MRLEARPPDLAAENRQLVAEHEDLQLLGSIAAAEEQMNSSRRRTTTYGAGTSEEDRQENGDADATSASTALALHLIEYLHPTGSHASRNVR